MLNTLVKLKAGSSRKPDLMRFFSPIWIHICASGFSTESTLSCSGLAESLLLGCWVRMNKYNLIFTQLAASCKVVSRTGSREKQLKFEKIWKFLFRMAKQNKQKALNNKSSEEWPLFLPPGAGNEWESCHPLLPEQTWPSHLSPSGSRGKGEGHCTPVGWGCPLLCVPQNSQEKSFCNYMSTA